ncbi:hypothetical protein [Dactylosporangium sp. CA-233914]|uniref:hypothetical protein n=1 Tax=Dactylosporangium sp. CA-233914 TaxID=3239934 RepID=UPI003D8B39C4
MFVWLAVSQTLEAVIAGCEQAWGFLSGVFLLLPVPVSYDQPLFRSCKARHRRRPGPRPDPHGLDLVNYLIDHYGHQAGNNTLIR